MNKELQNTIDTLVSKLLYYDRKEDEDLPPGEIELMLERGDVTVNEIVERFRSELVSYLSGADG